MHLGLIANYNVQKLEIDCWKIWFD